VAKTQPIEVITRIPYDPVPARSVIAHTIPITPISRMFRHCFRVFGLDLVGVAGDMLCFRSALRPEIRLSVARAG
jgi:hypothetical protein